MEKQAPTEVLILPRNKKAKAISTKKTMQTKEIVSQVKMASGRFKMLKTHHLLYHFLCCAYYHT